jgi:CheY-like chemotaxis protein
MSLKSELRATELEESRDDAPNGKMRTAKVTAFRILLVEDDEAVRRSTDFFLRVSGYQVACAGSLEDALGIVATDRSVDILITDFHLPNGRTGLNVIEHVRAVVGRTLPVVLTTGDTTIDRSDLPVDSRLRFTTKPVNTNHLLFLIEELLRAERG